MKPGKNNRTISSAASALWARHINLRYLVVGLWNTLIGYGFFFLLYLWLGDSIHYLIIAIFSHILAVTQSFLTQRYLVFCSKENWRGEYVRFHITHLGSLSFGLLALPVCIELFRLPLLIAQALIVGITIVGSFVAHRHYTFRKSA